MKDFIFYDRTFNEYNPLIIAELGTAHRGDFNRAEELIIAAVEAGATCIKFQHVYADEILHPATGIVYLPGGPTSLYKSFKALETGPEFLARAKEKTESLGALFLCSPFGIKSARELKDIGVKAIKIASPELNHVELLEETATYKLPIILSSGVSRLSDIEYALQKFNRVDRQLAIMHCITAYPAPEEEYNLSLLPGLATIFNLAIGLSDHSMDPVLVPKLAVAIGTSIIEKHFCLSNKDGGLDDKIALTPDSFALMVKSIKSTAKKRKALGAEGIIMELKEEYGQKRVEAVLGNGEKRLAPSEEANYERTNRSIHALRAIKKGEAFSGSNIAVLRTEKVLNPGLHPEFLKLLLSRKADKDITDGQGIGWADVGGSL